VSVCADVQVRYQSTRERAAHKTECVGKRYANAAFCVVWESASECQGEESTNARQRGELRQLTVCCLCHGREELLKLAACRGQTRDRHVDSASQEHSRAFLLARLNTRDSACGGGQGLGLLSKHFADKDQLLCDKKSFLSCGWVMRRGRLK
jgi:hypothetical protein